MEQGDDDAVALAGLLGAVQGRQHAGGQVQAHLVVTEAGDGQHGQGVLIEQGAQHAAAGKEGGEVEAGEILVGALLAVAGDEAVHQGGVLGVEGIVVQACLLQGVLAPVGDEDVRLGDQLLQGLTAGGRLGVQGDAGLVGVLQVVGGVLLLILGTALVDGGVAQGVACGSLNLDDLGAQVGQEACAAGRGDEGSQLDDLDALQRAFDLTHGFGSSYIVLFLLDYMVSMSRKVSILVRACSNCTIWRSISTTVTGMPAASQAFLIMT